MRTKNNHTFIIPNLNIQRYHLRNYKNVKSIISQGILTPSPTCFNQDMIKTESQLNKSIKLLDFKYLKLFHF